MSEQLKNLKAILSNRFAIYSDNGQSLKAAGFIEAIEELDALLALPAAPGQPEQPSVAEAARVLLEAYDGFMAGQPETETSRAVAEAACFAAAAYEKGFEGQNVHALARAFLIALIDPSDEQLDYLRADPSAGKAARALQAQQAEIAALRAQLADARREGFLLGFKSSGEGWNGEYGCDDPENDEYWLTVREEAIRLSALEGV